MNLPVDRQQLYKFLIKASGATYASSGVEMVEASDGGFKDLVFEEGELSYKDSYTGFYRSRGSETVRYKKKPIWVCSYGGGMVEGKEDLAYETFEFLKKAFRKKDEKAHSFRGPSKLVEGDWEYTYEQDGDTEEFWGYEEIHYKGELVFYHRTIGGIVIPRK